jgi:hypothetical protein
MIIYAPSGKQNLELGYGKIEDIKEIAKKLSEKSRIGNFSPAHHNKLRDIV